MSDDNKPIFRENEETFVCYSNTAQVSSSTHDFRIRFAIAGDDGRPDVKATVYLSAGHAKSFLIALANQVARYESKIGEIHRPKLTGEDDTEEEG